MAVVTEQKLGELAQQLGECLRDKGLTLATAESCTGGWIAKLITDIPGSSDWFEGSIVSYSNALKINLLHVPESVIATHGAVSRETVLAMSDGLFNVTGADVAISVSGIAGPGGGTADKPVGTVWLSWGARGHNLHTDVVCFQGEREAIRLQAMEKALILVTDLTGCGK